jgi:xanthine dehydrogenase molybdenum-binding subunit
MSGGEAPLATVGQRLPKLDSPAKAAGTARYVDDLRWNGLVSARLVRSWEAHARVTSVDLGLAREVDGFVDALSCLDIAERVPGLASFDPACHDFERAEPYAPLPGDATVLDPIARFVGDPVAIVGAETDAAAVEAAGLVDVGYESLPAVFNVHDARAVGAPTLHEGAPDNVATRVEMAFGDVDEAIAGAAAVVTIPVHTSKQKQAQMEPTTCVAEVDSTGITVWSPHQSPHRARHTLAHLFGRPLSQIRVVSPVIGGAFGKGDALTGEPYAIALSSVLGRPVRLRFSRTEDFIGTESRHPAIGEATAAFAADGTITALRAHLALDAGAYLSHSPRIAIVLAKQVYEMYAIPNVDITVEVVFTNKPVSGAFRGYGGPQAAWVTERLIDLGARKLGVDTVEARLKMLARESPSGLSRANVAACLERGREVFAAGQTERPASGGRIARGVGVACVSWKSGVADKPGSLDRSQASVKPNEDGSVDVLTAACDLGTGVSTTLAQIAAETLGIPMSRVRMSPTDTAVTPFDSGAFASRSLYRAGEAVRLAAQSSRARILDYAAELLEAGEDDLVLADSTVSVKGAPARSMPLGELLHNGLMGGRDFRGDGDVPNTGARSAAAQFAEVEVDLDTGQVRVVRLVAAHDVGKAINPTLVEGQIQGGAYQGLGYALTEDLVVDPDNGATLTGTFMDYRILTARDGPRVETVIVEIPDPSGPYGAKGVGEPSIILAAPTIANAIHNAIGVFPARLPMTPECVYEAICSADSVPA